jgi:alkylation response protein AidB-like acyl-CoA dehydrogenase
MELAYTPEQAAFRAEVRAWMQAHVPKAPLPHLATKDGFEAHRAWEAELNAGRWAAVTWPEEYGGRGLDLIRWLIFEEEYWAAGAPERANQNGVFLLAPTMMEYGTPEQKARFLPKMAASEEVWAQAWSEPQAGSDLAAVRSTATRDGDEYVLRGHKIWSSRAVFADWAFGLFRTDPDSQRHKGLSLILFDLRSEGVQVRPIPQINGLPGFAEIFLDGARAKVAHRLGDEGQGWSVCMSTAGFERGLMLRSPGRFQAAAARLVALAQSRTLDAAQEAAVLQAAMDAEAYALSIYATASDLIRGGKIGPETSCNKIFWSELDLNLHRAAMSILGARAELVTHGQADDWLDGFLFSLAGPIYAGANEIQRNIVAERVLGLPKG